MNLAIVLNSSAGSVSEKGFTMPDIKQAFRNLGVETEIVVIDKKPLNEIVKFLTYKDYDVIAAAGGDGTISGVASLLIGSKQPLAVLPFGTLNHFAKDIGIPMDLDGAAAVIAAGKTAKIDIGIVNEEIFINNSSIGIYPKIVKLRESNKNKLNGKWIAMIDAFISVFSRFPVSKVRIVTESKDTHVKTPFVFIGNNEYGTDIFSLGTRTRLDKGFLNLYYPVSSGRLSMIRFFFHALLNTLDQQHDFNVQQVKEITIESRKKYIDVSIDGEIINMPSPLHYSIKPGALTVIVP
jgi:diacylglycerol kinase family enzyme